MKCPIDNTELVKVKYEDLIDIDTCEACQGAWLDKGELEKIQDVVTNDYKLELEKLPDYISKAYSQAFAKTKPIVNCPVCNTEMERKEYAYCSQILIDSCINGHGVWLDKNELQSLEVFYEKMTSETKDVRKGFLAGLFDSIKQS